jgi:hypothetical protein
MAYRLRVTATNKGAVARRIVIYGGTVFEVNDPFSNTQNLVATTQTTAVIPPGQTQAIEIDTWCLNPNFAPPNNTPMRPTILAAAQTYASQDEVWSDMRGRQ